MKYKIFKSEYYNKNGEAKSTHFFIKKRKKFLGFTYWRSIRHDECGYCNTISAITQFKTKEDAIVFIKDVLCKDIPRDKWVDTQVDELTCKK